MSYLIKKKRSPYWYLRIRDLETGRWVEKCTKLRHDDPKESAKAMKEAAKATTGEVIARPRQGENFSEWVPDYIRQHYEGKPLTQLRNLYFWRTIHVFLHENGIRHPREIRYEHAAAYMAWRKGPDGNNAAHNTARNEVKFLAFLMSEAIRRELAERNPIALARIELAPAKAKREISDAEIAAFRKEFEKEESWMGTAFELLINLGCRFTEARVSKERIDFDRLTIQLTDSKRDALDPRKYFTAPISEQLATFLKRIAWYDGHTMPVPTRMMNRNFNRALHRAAPGVTSHCCRVSFISRCHRAGLSEHEAMRLVNHSTRMVHRLYSKLNVEDARTAMMKVPLPPPPGRGTAVPSEASYSSRKKGSRASSAPRGRQGTSRRTRKDAGETRGGRGRSAGS